MPIKAQLFALPVFATFHSRVILPRGFRKFHLFRILRLSPSIPIMAVHRIARRRTMTTAALTSIPPSKEDVELARASGQRLAPLARRGRPLTLRVRDADREETIELPAGAVKL